MALRQIVGHLEEKLDGDVEFASTSTVLALTPLILGLKSQEEHATHSRVPEADRQQIISIYQIESYIQSTFPNKESDNILHNASDFFSLQFT